jgi:integrase
VLLAFAGGFRMVDVLRLQRKNLAAETPQLMRVTVLGSKGSGLPVVRWVSLLGVFRVLGVLLGQGPGPVFNVASTTVARYLREAGFSLHSPRRGAATTLAGLGWGLRAVAAFLAHASPNTTRWYVDVAPAQPEQVALRKMSVFLPPLVCENSLF